MRGPIIKKEYVDDYEEILYFGSDDVINPTRNKVELKTKDDNILNRGHRFLILKDGRGNNELEGEEFEVIGWVEKDPSCRYDFILHDNESKRYYLANLRGRLDGWPLFTIQNGKPTCARSKMGSEWNCRLCIKYFNTVCSGR